jgi:hypothetical protein
LPLTLGAGHTLPQRDEVQHDFYRVCYAVAFEGPHSAERLKRMKHRLIPTLLVVASLVVATLSAVTMTARPALAATGPAWPIDTWGTPRGDDDNVILQWDEQLLSAIRAYPTLTGPTRTARALGVLHTATYDAWAAYDPAAIGTRPESPTAPPDQNNQDNKEEAISYAAYRVLEVLTPATTFKPVDPVTNPPGYSTPNVLMEHLGYTAGVTLETAPTDAAKIGVAAANAVLQFRSSDDFNLSPGGYTGSSTWDTVVKWHWQPLCVPLVTSGTPCPNDGKHSVQSAYTPKWGNGIPFDDLDDTTHLPKKINPALFHPPYTADGNCCDPTDIDTALRDTSSLTDAQKVRAEYWADGPKSEFPPGHMALFASALSRMHQNTLDQDVKLFFVLGNALMDASISAWAVKYKYDFWRPVTAIRYQYKDKQVNSWLGPGKGYGRVLGQNWQPYQLSTVVTPNFPEYVSGHSTFSAAGRSVLISFFGTDNFNAKVTIKAGSSKIEPQTPARDVVLSWNTLTASADEAGMSRRYGGIHFKTGDEHGRALGKVIGFDDWDRAQYYFKGSVPPDEIPPPFPSS